MEPCEGEPPLFQLDDPSTQQFIKYLGEFRAFYGPIHGYICVFLCIFGFFSNAIHVIVLTRRSMRGSAVNAIMTCVAICDMGTMASYLVYILHFVLRSRDARDCENVMTFVWMWFLLGHMFLSITLHTTTLWLAVAMAFMRRMTLHAATLNSKYQNSRLAKRISLGVFILVVLFSLPTVMVHEIVVYREDVWRPATNKCQAYGYADNYTEPMYTLARSPRAHQNGCRYFKLNLWLTGLLFKVVPCILLLILSSSLLVKLRRAEQKRRVLLLNSGSDGSKRIASDRTTALLLTILGVFLATELPQGVLSLLSSLYTNDIHHIVYFMLGDILDLLSLVNSSVNFVLYCLMSSRYRHTFCATVLPAAFLFKCSENAPHINSAHLTNTDFPSRLFAVRNGDINENWANPITRRRSSPGVRLLRQSMDESARIPLSARPSRVA
ncbi:hypothetical protein M3Y94_00134200 [Aphelenchoides besseyi]|nr:hypothetical protein M3Y94_00134200 [Aphelenchoides besseyi]